jgi:transaldolase
VTGLTSNPTIFDDAIRNTKAYDDAIRLKVKEGKSSEALFFELALEDLTQASTLFRPIYEVTGGVDGWVSLGKVCKSPGVDVRVDYPGR